MKTTIISFLLISFILNINCLKTFQKVLVPQCSADHSSFYDIENIYRKSGYIPYFQHNDGSGVADSRIQVQICHREFKNLDVTFFIRGRNFESQFTHCNDPINTDNSVGILVGSQQSYLREYVEIYLNTQGSMRGSKIKNYSGDCQYVIEEPLQCKENGIFYSSQDNREYYAINVEIPVKIITGEETATNLKFNLSKIEKQGENKFRYSSFIPTRVFTVNNQACFHVPESFADLILTEQQIDDEQQ